ncbi:glycosyltransferase family 2 protein [Nitrospirillum sp. BR 11164]|uniref:glycosyltransferase family 2 protein n=1 Tax=Nitrospirillum sp. BR 11164 TaxID=3104324 RepID=UPI002AFE80F1|nr:glycosyltransferase family 2 protein [Nitrospirillum sp. BR 11164]MEA1652608.1 glycosyltransferase family 2 protein [Nitrospirillum sp. BR 11164]
MGLRYTILISVLNEQGNILPLLEELQAVAPYPGDYEVLFVDDGSTDDTPDELQQAKAKYPFVRVVRHGQRAGKSRAIRTGCHAAKTDWIMMVDGDMQNDPRDIAPMLAAVERDPEVKVVCGIRRRRDDTLAKKITSRLGNGIRRALLRDGCPDTGCGFKLVHRAAMLELPQFDAVHRFIPTVATYSGWKMANVPINDRKRHAGRSKYTNIGRAFVGFFDLLGMLWMLRRNTMPGTAREV